MLCPLKHDQLTLQIKKKNSTSVNYTTKTTEECHPSNDWETSLALAYKLSYYRRLLIEKYNCPHAPGNRREWCLWISLLLAETDIQRLLNCEKTVSDGSTLWVCIHTLPPSSQRVIFRHCHCARIMVRLWCQLCAGHIDAAYYKFRNHLYVSKLVTGWKRVY